MIWVRLFCDDTHGGRRWRRECARDGGMHCSWMEAEQEDRAAMLDPPTRYGDDARRIGRSPRHVRGTVGAGLWGGERWEPGHKLWLTEKSQVGHVRGAQRRQLSVRVALPMATLQLLRLVECPVLVEIATGTKRFEAQHSLSSSQTPAHTVRPSRSCTKWRQAPSTPEPIGRPAARYWS